MQRVLSAPGATRAPQVFLQPPFPRCGPPAGREPAALPGNGPVRSSGVGLETSLPGGEKGGEPGQGGAGGARHWYRGGAARASPPPGPGLRRSAVTARGRTAAGARLAASPAPASPPPAPAGGANHCGWPRR